MDGVRSGVNGTPTFFINGTRFDDSWDEETLGAAIEHAIAGGGAAEGAQRPSGEADAAMRSARDRRAAHAAGLRATVTFGGHVSRRDHPDNPLRVAAHAVDHF